MPHPIDILVGIRLKEIRILAGKSQGDLAGEIGITFQQVQKYETGTNRISASRLYEIAMVFGTSVSYFFSNSDDKFTNTQSDRKTKASREIFSRSESLSLLRAYYNIENSAVRKQLFDLIKSVATSSVLETDATPADASGMLETV